MRLRRLALLPTFLLLSVVACSSSVATSADGTDAANDSSTDVDRAVCADETTAVDGAACNHPGDHGCAAPSACVLCYHDTWAMRPMTCDCVAGTWKCSTVGIYDCFGPIPGTYSDAACTHPNVAIDAGGETADADARETGDASETGGAKCGTVTCGASEYCVRPCCGGADTGTPCTPPAPYCTVTSCVPGTVCSGVCPSGGSGYLDATKKEIACVCG